MNRLAGATSPYLLQHASQPVLWWPWCDEALEAAREADKPILLSIGYSACHWCHVMAAESFSDTETAEVINEHFVSIKVDREERPDLDRIYQLSHQVITDQPGGWPLTLILEPENQSPFFAGTYFPAQGRHGVPGFSEVLKSISKAWETRREDLDQQTDRLKDFLTRAAQVSATDQAPDASPGEAALLNIERQYDARHGGFGSAPKFPNPALLRYLMTWSAFTPDDRRDAEDMVSHTLQRMAEGGLFDQLGGGFFRYSVDGVWGIPHFEKMLSDNAQLLWIYAHAAAEVDQSFADAARTTAKWVVKTMQSPNGGYLTAVDADTNGEEGSYYLWDKAEFEGLLSPEEAHIAGACWGLSEAPNFEGRLWHLGSGQPLRQVAKQIGVGRSLALDCLHNARKKLLQARRQRTVPARDDKILASVNGLMIGAMAKSARVLGDTALLKSAQDALGFVRRHLWQDGRLLAVSRGGRHYQMGYLDDYAFVLDGLLEMMATSFRPADLEWARHLARALLTHFEDPYEGGFFFTAHDHEKLIQRPRPLQDESTPSGNAVAARSLLRLGRLLDNLMFVNAAERVLRCSWGELHRAPQACCTMLGALDEWLHPPNLVVLRGAPDLVGPVWEALRRSNHHHVYYLDPNSLLERYPVQGSFTAYRCEGTHCSEPITDPRALASAA
ncbi:MAG: thioredoxin domain-containing protein [Pseudomonadota bacterium]